MNRQEMRSLRRELPVADRLKLMQKHEYRKAALELPPEMSALPASEYTRLFEEELAQKHPDIVEGVAQAEKAVRIVSRVIETATEAVTNELISAGSTIQEPVAEPAPQAWVN
jgi:hypothetical protein